MGWLKSGGLAIDEDTGDIWNRENKVVGNVNAGPVMPPWQQPGQQQAPPQMAAPMGPPAPAPTMGQALQPGPGALPAEGGSPQYKSGGEMLKGALSGALMGGGAAAGEAGMVKALEYAGQRKLPAALMRLGGATMGGAGGGALAGMMTGQGAGPGAAAGAFSGALGQGMTETGRFIGTRIKEAAQGGDVGLIGAFANKVGNIVGLGDVVGKRRAGGEQVPGAIMTGDLANTYYETKYKPARDVAEKAVPAPFVNPTLQKLLSEGKTEFFPESAARQVKEWRRLDSLLTSKVKDPKMRAFEIANNPKYAPLKDGVPLSFKEQEEAISHLNDVGYNKLSGEPGAAKSSPQARTNAHDAVQDMGLVLYKNAGPGVANSWLTARQHLNGVKNVERLLQASDPFSRGGQLGQMQDLLREDYWKDFQRNFGHDNALSLVDTLTRGGGLGSSDVTRTLSAHGSTTLGKPHLGLAQFLPMYKVRKPITPGVGQFLRSSVLPGMVGYGVTPQSEEEQQ